MAINARCCYFLSGQHSLTSVERPSYLRSDFVNVWRHARFVVPPVSHVLSFASIFWWSDVCFEVLSCFFDHPSIDSTKKMPLHLFGKDVLMFCPIKPLSASIRSFQQMLLSNILWMAPDRMAFMKKLHEQANKTQMNCCPIQQLYQILTGI